MTESKRSHRGGARALKRLRAICAALPESLETKTFGHPTFQAGKGRTFVVLDDHEQPGLLCLVVKLDSAEQKARVDGVRVFPSRFGAKHGWTAVRVDADTDWDLAKDVVIRSFRSVALKRMIASLEAGKPTRPA